MFGIGHFCFAERFDLVFFTFSSILYFFARVFTRCGRSLYLCLVFVFASDFFDSVFWFPFVSRLYYFCGSLCFVRCCLIFICAVCLSYLIPNVRYFQFLFRGTVWFAVRIFVAICESCIDIIDRILIRFSVFLLYFLFFVPCFCVSNFVFDFLFCFSFLYFFYVVFFRRG